MSTQKHSVPVVVKDKDRAGRKVGSHTYHVSNDHRVDSHTFAGLPDGDYPIEFNLPLGIELKPNSSSTLKIRGGMGELSVSLDELIASDTFLSQESSSSSEQSSSNNSLALLLGASVVSLVALGNLKVPVDFSSMLYPPKTLQPQQVRLSTQSSRTNARGQPETTLEFTATSVGGQSEAASLSALGNKLRACLTTNIRDVWDVPTLADLAKKTTLVTVTDEQVREETNQLYDKVDRLRQILQGCDPNLARYLIKARSRENVAQPHFTDRASTRFAQSLASITISTCAGRPGSAYFRSDPTLAEWAILGIVEQGEQVYLTDETYEADGVVWYEAIAPSVAPDPDKQIMPNQIGWIAGCFVQ